MAKNTGSDRIAARWTSLLHSVGPINPRHLGNAIIIAHRGDKCVHCVITAPKIIPLPDWPPLALPPRGRCQSQSRDPNQRQHPPMESQQRKQQQQQQQQQQSRRRAVLLGGGAALLSAASAGSALPAVASDSLLMPEYIPQFSPPRSSDAGSSSREADHNPDGIGGSSAAADGQQQQQQPPPQQQTEVTQRVFIDVGLCPTAVRTGVDRRVGDASVLCSDPEPLGRLVIGLYGKVRPRAHSAGV